MLRILSRWILYFLILTFQLRNSFYIDACIMKHFIISSKDCSFVLQVLNVKSVILRLCSSYDSLYNNKQKYFAPKISEKTKIIKKSSKRIWSSVFTMRCRKEFQLLLLLIAIVKYGKSHFLTFTNQPFSNKETSFYEFNHK